MLQFHTAVSSIALEIEKEAPKAPQRINAYDPHMLGMPARKQ